MARKIRSVHRTGGLAAGVGAILCVVLGCQSKGGGRPELSADSSAATVVPPVGQAPDRTVPSDPVVLFLGTSLTAGMGLELEEAYPALIQAKIDSAQLRFRAVNAGVSGETSAGGLRRIDWLLREPVAVLVVELGGNDGLRGLDIEAMRRNLQAIIDRTRALHPEARILIAGMESPPNMGDRYTSAFRLVFPDLAAANRAQLIPFILDGVGGVPALNQADGIHPTAEGQRLVAENVWRVLGPVLEDLAKVPASR